MHAATGEAGFTAAEGNDAGNFHLAMRAVIKVFARHFSARSQRQRVAGFFFGDSEGGAGLPPFFAMRGEAAFRVARVGHEMRHFVQESLAQFAGKIEQAGVELYSEPPGAGATGRGAQARVPAEAQVYGQHGQAEMACQHPCFVLHHPQNLCGITGMQGGLRRLRARWSNQ